MAEKKYYWLKMPKGFLGKHYMRIIKAKDNGAELSLFYIWMLTESIDHAGRLRYSDDVAYDVEMLSDASSFSEEIVEEALRLFQRLELIDISEDGTIFMTKGNKMIGSETSAAGRMRRFREKSCVQDSYDDVTQQSQNSDEYIEKEIEKDIDIEKESKKKFSLSDCDFEKAWNNTFELYPKKAAAVIAKQIWMKKIADVVVENQQMVATLIFRATKRYLADYDEKNPDDAEYHKFIPKYGDWLVNDCDYWIQKCEKAKE